MAPHWRERGRHVLLAAVTAVLVLVATFVAPASDRDLDPLGYALISAGSLALVARQRFPRTVVVITTTYVSGYFLLGYPGSGAALPLLVALYTAVRTGHRAIALVPVAALVIDAIVNVVVEAEPARQVVEDRFLLAGWIVASVMMGAAMRQWSAYVREAEERAAEAERTREEMARRRADEERLRIARELHDSLTHTISVIKVQAGVAVHLARKRGEDVPDALVAIQEASGEAIRELRITLEALRSDDEPPEHGLTRLDELVERARAAGLPTEVSVTGAARPLPVEVDRTAYRIIQEALTNVARHAGPAKATVRVSYLPGELAIQIDDDGVAVAEKPPTPGVGLLGMRERVDVLRGSLTTGPRDEGGFTVRAEIPTEVSA